MIKSLVAAMCMLAVTALGGCALTGAIANPSEVGCQQVETNACRVVIAGYIIKGANVSIGEQFDRGALTQAEALKLRAVTKEAEGALEAAVIALPLADGTLDERLLALDGILLRLIQAQLTEGVTQ